MVEDKNIKEKYILAVDTTTLDTTVSLAKGSEIVETLVDKRRSSQSSNLLMLIDELLTSKNLNIDEIDIFSIATGPGSFTGARVGISTIKGLSYSLDKFCVGVPTLKALAHAAGSSFLTLSLLPAGRGEVFVEKFEVNTEREVVSLSPAINTSIKAILEEVKDEPNVKWIGYGCELLKDEIISFAAKSGKALSLKNDNRQRVKDWSLICSGYIVSESVALLSYEQLSGSGLDNVFHEIRAEYVRPPQ